MSKSPVTDRNHGHNNINLNTINPSPSLNARSLILPSTNTANSSPSKRPRNSEMYNKIINLKSKLANYNNNSVLLSQRNERNNDDSKIMSRTLIDNSQDLSPLHTEEGNNFGFSGINCGGNAPGTGRPIMSKINELKKKWNDVSSRTRADGETLTPDKNRLGKK
jgi:hypothetical protein